MKISTPVNELRFEDQVMRGAAHHSKIAGSFLKRPYYFISNCGFILILALLPSFPSAAGVQQADAPSSQSAPASPASSEAVLPGDWAPELLYGILNSPNSEAADELYRAAFASGPALVPQLQAALKDDRTAEFAAQSLAFIGGEKALEVLSKLVNDPRNLDLRRFFYGALGEYQTSQADQVLLDVVNRGDEESDRTVTEAAIIALTVRSDPALIPPLRQAIARIKDVVIRDDIENALDVIAIRAKYLASPEGKKAGGSIEQAVRTYFIPALEPQWANGDPPSQGEKSRGRPPSTPARVEKNEQHRPEAAPPVTVHIEHLIFSPDESRALARVIFEVPTASANYDIVLKKRLGDWTICSVWLGAEVERNPAGSRPSH